MVSAEPNIRLFLIGYSVLSELEVLKEMDLSDNIG